MGQWMFLYLFLFCVTTPGLNGYPNANVLQESSKNLQKMEEISTAMEALDLVQNKFATNFEKVYVANSEEYYYKLPFADYYLVYEGGQESEKGQDPEEDYLIHLYEFVIDEPDTGVGHAVTYGWFIVEPGTGVITEYVG